MIRWKGGRSSRTHWTLPPLIRLSPRSPAEWLHNTKGKSNSMRHPILVLCLLEQAPLMSDSPGTLALFLSGGEPPCSRSHDSTNGSSFIMRGRERQRASSSWSHIVQGALSSALCLVAPARYLQPRLYVGPYCQETGAHGAALHS